MTKILFRKTLAEEEEFSAACKYFDVIESRTDIKPNDTIIGRYSVLPYYTELERDTKKLGATLINSYRQHRFVADIQNWYHLLSDFTPTTWMRLPDIPEDCPLVIKGETNSRKQLWKTHMFAENKQEARAVYNRLLDDSLIGHQQIYFRKYESLKSYGTNEITGCPIGKEYRFFVYNGQVLCGDFYWSEVVDDLDERPSADDVPRDFLQAAVDRVKDHVPFFVIDVAQKENDEWIVIELNDGQMSGLSCIEPEELYKNLKDTV